MNNIFKFEKCSLNNGVHYSLESLGYVLDSIDDFTSSIQINPNDANVYFLRGMAYQGIGNYNEALSDISMANKMKPNFELYSSSLLFLENCLVGNEDLIALVKSKASEEGKLKRRFNSN